jgi:hypothetical protein
MTDKDQILLENLYSKIHETDDSASADMESSSVEDTEREEDTEEKKEETSTNLDSFMNVYLNVLEAASGSKPCPCKKVDGKCVKRGCECKQCEKVMKDK